KHHMPSILSTAIDPIRSTSSTTMLPTSITEKLNSKIENLLPLPIKVIPERPIGKGRTKQQAKMLTSTSVKVSLFEKKIRKRKESSAES
ncbi:hypothetical protein HHI36_017372, partial [Cryptolaemus montrouzieri]